MTRLGKITCKTFNSFEIFNNPLFLISQLLTSHLPVNLNSTKFQTKQRISLVLARVWGLTHETNYPFYLKSFIL